MKDEAAGYTLGPLPWSNAHLERAVMLEGGQVQKWVNEHPGFEMVQRLESLKTVLGIFDRSATQFGEVLELFHKEAAGGRIFQRNRRQDLEAIAQRVCELLYLFASSAMTLVEQSRALSRELLLPGYAARTEQDFAVDPQHRFIQELRNDLVHVALHRPAWQLVPGSEDTCQSRLLLWPDQLSRASSYSAQARAFLEQHPSGIDLRELVAGYGTKVREFHAWLNREVQSVAGDRIADYLRCRQSVRAASSRCLWNIILKQIVIEGKRDPYSYLDHYLTEEELRDVRARPHRSRSQIDRIVELIDEDGACDGELRQIVYEAFGAVDR